MKIKICGLREEYNMREIIELSPDFAGFIFYEKSPRYFLNAKNPASVSGKLKGIQKVGVFVNQSLDDINAIADRYSLDYIQLHGSESPRICAGILSRGRGVIKAFSVADPSDLALISEYNEVCNYFLFDTQSQLHGGSGQKFNWEILQQASISRPFFLSGGIGPGDVPEILKFSHPQFAGIDLNSKFESAPGIKDLALLKIFLTELHEF